MQFVRTDEDGNRVAVRGGQLAQILKQNVFCLDVEVGERLVHDEQPRLPDQSPCERKAQLVAARERIPAHVEVLAQAETFDHEPDLALVFRPSDAADRRLEMQGIAQGAAPGK
jgi:hypothetical protein